MQAIGVAIALRREGCAEDPELLQTPLYLPFK